jgi:guanylate kinase
LKTQLLLFAAPSGAGKTTLVRHILATFPDQFEFSISACTRPPRPNEIDGKDYYFITPEEFRVRIAQKQFVEYEQVYENQYYGTLKSEVERIANNGKRVIFDIDVKGALNIKRQYPQSAQCVFVQPPSVEILLERLRNRATETHDSLRKRIDKAKVELTFAPKFDTIIVNNDLQTALSETENLVRRLLLEE